MIFRKPYAFLIKNFRKIHIVLLLLCAFIYYKTMELTSFINEFATYLSYDPYLEPITKYTSIAFYIVILIIIATILTLIILLKRKNKPWKLYLVLAFTYIGMFLIFSYTGSYFSKGELSTSAPARAIHDFLFIGTIPQYISFLILFIRITGLDLNKFGFKNDKEFLELEQDDREEFEVSVNIDKDAFKRGYKKVLRLIRYFYEEHRFIMNIIITVAGISLIGYTFYYFGIAHKTINETKNLNANGYTITINKSYYTNKDKTGNIIEKDSSFVILNMTIINNSGQRELEANNFHLVNGNTDTTFSEGTYSKYFDDIGNSYSNRTFNKGEKRTFAMIFKVDNKLNKNNFVLYYQQYKSSKKSYLRKMKIKLTDVSNINTNASKNVGEEITIKFPDGNSENFTFEDVSIEDNSNYNIETCNSDDECSVNTKNFAAEINYKNLKIGFSSDNYEGQDLIDFSTNYGKIKYIDSENIAREIEIKDALQNKKYLGKYIYIKVPNEIEKANQIEIIYTVRNQKYYYKIR